jgi:hypothetical protein
MDWVIVIPGWCASTRPQGCNCTLGNLEIPGSRYRAPRNDEVYPSNFSLETISIPKPDSPL